MLRKLLALFDEDDGFKLQSMPAQMPKKDVRVLQQVVRRMQILEKIWNEDGKYARKWSIKNCWLKADFSFAVE